MSRCFGIGMSSSSAHDKPAASSSSNGKGSFVSRLRRKLTGSKSQRHGNSKRTDHKSDEKNNNSTTSSSNDHLGSSTASCSNEKKHNPIRPGAMAADAGPDGKKKPQLGRMATVQALKRQESERRERLKPIPEPRRSDIRNGLLPPIQSQSTVEVREATPSPVTPNFSETPLSPAPPPPPPPISSPAAPRDSTTDARQPSPVPPRAVAATPPPQNSVAPASPQSPGSPEHTRPSRQIVSQEIEQDLTWRWILNLSMHFRDQSNREKFFVTYAETPVLRRRVTISCDYRNAEEGSLEDELSRLRLQRDKSAKIFEAIRESLEYIKFYNTITNLKLQTSEGRLHVHVTEDVNEIIPFPPVNSIRHLHCPMYRESDLVFDSHLSGFVYKVLVDGQVMIKKEIPGPETVDEFLYEIHALNALADSENVIRFGGVVVDDAQEKVKGLLISYAEKGALIDIVYNDRGMVPWKVREKWAKQIAGGLAEIHEAGYVQGDFTLSNIVIDGEDNAKIIDINRRGCPVGWEPPEVSAIVEGFQRIGMYIGVKSDVFQLGMVLWGLAHEMDEPESVARPLTMDRAPEDVPAYFKDIVNACLYEKPQGRPSAKEVVRMFPELLEDPPTVLPRTEPNGQPLPGIRSWEDPTPQPIAAPPATSSSGLTSENLQAHTLHNPQHPLLPPSSPSAIVVTAVPSNASTSSLPKSTATSVSVGGVGIAGSSAQTPQPTSHFASQIRKDYFDQVQVEVDSESEYTRDTDGDERGYADIRGAPAGRRSVDTEVEVESPTAVEFVDARERMTPKPLGNGLGVA